MSDEFGPYPGNAFAARPPTRRRGRFTHSELARGAIGKPERLRALGWSEATVKREQKLQLEGYTLMFHRPTRQLVALPLEESSVTESRMADFRAAEARGEQATDHSQFDSFFEGAAE